jgi:chromosomal replication initiator protein
MIAVNWGEPQEKRQTVPLLPMHQIAVQVASQHGISHAEIISHRRQRPLVRARQEAMYRCKKETSYSFVQIARYFGGRDHTTVLHAVSKHEARMKEVEG